MFTELGVLYVVGVGKESGPLTIGVIGLQVGQAVACLQVVTLPQRRRLSILSFRMMPACNSASFSKS